MSFTKTVFYVPTNSAQITIAVPAADASLSQTIDDTLQADEGVALTAGKTFQLLNGFYSSPRLKFDDIVSFKQIVQSDGTPQKSTATVVKNADTGIAEVKLIDVTDGREKFTIETFEANESTNNLTADAIAAEIEKLDNVTSAAATANAILITFVADVVYRLAANAESSVAYTGGSNAVAVASVGKAAEVKAALAEGMAFKGVTNQGGSNIVSPGFAAAVDCDKSVIEVVTTVGDRKDRHEIIVYAAEGGATDKLYQNLASIFANV